MQVLESLRNGKIYDENTQVIDARGRYLVPGLLDGHMHVELGMVTVTEFVRAVAVRGTTGMFIDPHEIANVFGLRGVKLMADEALKQPIHVWVQMPSCVPSAPGLETPGAQIGPKEVAEAMKWKNIFEDFEASTDRCEDVANVIEGIVLKNV